MGIMCTNMRLHVCVSRVPDQNGVSLLYIMLEIHHSGWVPSIYVCVCVCVCVGERERESYRWGHCVKQKKSAELSIIEEDAQSHACVFSKWRKWFEKDRN